MADLEFGVKMQPSAAELVSRFRMGERIVTEGQRKGMQAQGRRLYGMVQQEAPGRFGDKVRMSIHYGPDNTRVEIGVPQPLGGWITKGTRPHVIRPKGPGYPLRFFWAKGPKGPGIYHYYSVNHPGTKPNPFIARAYRRWLPDAKAEMIRLGRAYVRTVTGAQAGQFF